MLSVVFVCLFKGKLHVTTADLFKCVHLGTAIFLNHLSTCRPWPLVMLKLVYLEKRAVDLHLKYSLVLQTDNVTQCRKIKYINFSVIIMLFHIRGTWCSDPFSQGTIVKFFQFA